MANTYSTLELPSAKEKFPYTRKLTVLEAVVQPTKFNDIGVSYRPVHFVPCLMIKGKWFAEAGFEIGQKITIGVHENELVIMPQTITSKTEAAEL